MATVNWPSEDRRAIIGKRTSRIDGPAKATGAAKYAYDMNPPNLLHAKILFSPHANTTVTAVDTSEVESIPGVAGVYVDTDRRGALLGELAIDVGLLRRLHVDRDRQSHDLGVRA